MPSKKATVSSNYVILAVAVFLLSVFLACSPAFANAQTTGENEENAPTGSIESGQVSDFAFQNGSAIERDSELTAPKADSQNELETAVERGVLLDSSKSVGTGFGLAESAEDESASASFDGLNAAGKTEPSDKPNEDNGTIVNDVPSSSTAASTAANPTVAHDETSKVSALSVSAKQAAKSSVQGPELVDNNEYVLVSRSNQGQILDVMGDSKKSGGNVATYASNYDWWQKFRPVEYSDGVYELIASHSNLALTADGAARGSNVTQRTFSKSNYQLWRFESAGSGWWRLANVASGLYLDVCGGKASNGTNVWLWDADASNGGLGQMWKLVWTPYRTVYDGVYSIAADANQDEVLDVAAASEKDSANVALYYYNGQAHQKWDVSYQPNGYYKITSVRSGKVLDLEGGSRGGASAGANVSQFTDWGTSNQYWLFQSCGAGAYQVLSRSNGNLALALAQGKAVSSENVVVEEANADSKSQAWHLNSVLDGYYVIRSADKRSDVLDVVASSHKNGANVTLWGYTGRPNQYWRIANAGGRYYTLVSIESWQALDVVASGAKNGTNVTQWSQTGGNNQAWLISDNGNGAYSFISKATGNYLDVQGGHAGAGVNVWTWEKTTNNAGKGQRWVLDSKLTLDARVALVSSVPGNGLQVFGASAQLSSKSKTALNNAIKRYKNDGYNVGFFMMDLETGSGVSYNIDKWFFSASTVKGPYVVGLCESNPNVLSGWRGEIWDTVIYSNNEAYASLCYDFGMAPYEYIANRVGASWSYTTNYANYPARSLAKLWCGMSDFFLNGKGRNADFCRNVFSNNMYITARKTITGADVVYGKSGWMEASSGAWCDITNEGALIVENGHPYIIVVESNVGASQGTYYLGNLDAALQRAHADLARQLNG